MHTRRSQIKKLIPTLPSILVVGPRKGLFLELNKCLKLQVSGVGVSSSIFLLYKCWIYLYFVLYTSFHQFVVVYIRISQIG